MTMDPSLPKGVGVFVETQVAFQKNSSLIQASAQLSQSLGGGGIWEAKW